MKSVLSLIVVCFVVMAQCQDVPTKSCPQGEHSVLYCPPVAEPSCDKPYIHKLESPQPCGRAQCFCNTGTVRNTKTNKCVELENCC